MKRVKSFLRITWLDALCSCIPLQNLQKSHLALCVLVAEKILATNILQLHVTHLTGGVTARKAVTET